MYQGTEPFRAFSVRNLIKLEISEEEEEEDIFSALPTLYTDIDYLT